MKVLFEASFEEFVVGDDKVVLFLGVFLDELFFELGEDVLEDIGLDSSRGTKVFSETVLGFDYLDDLFPDVCELFFNGLQNVCFLFQLHQDLRDVCLPRQLLELNPVDVGQQSVLVRRNEPRCLANIN